ncbi:hypothetical protein FOMPIDRAFT_1044333 [Fomitopsis schrenkii]|uniref:Uncharacterized protein n=1 Tax=Fomitopsis schrenkii TaxID=2126942 RepID=S8EL61_FOMSC|nr:hypothetical protein FOMPIDRAFT_1044333 [Fomitopsis schrenkii]
MGPNNVYVKGIQKLPYFAHSVNEAGTRLLDHDEVRARMALLSHGGPPALENYLAYPTLPTAGLARPLSLPRQQATPRHTGISPGDAAAQEVDQDREACRIQNWVPEQRTTPRHNVWATTSDKPGSCLLIGPIRNACRTRRPAT